MVEREGTRILDPGIMSALLPGKLNKFQQLDQANLCFRPFPPLWNQILAPRVRDFPVTLVLVSCGINSPSVASARRLHNADAMSPRIIGVGAAVTHDRSAEFRQDHS